MSYANETCDPWRSMFSSWASTTKSQPLHGWTSHPPSIFSPRLLYNEFWLLFRKQHFLSPWEADPAIMHLSTEHYLLWWTLLISTLKNLRRGYHHCEPFLLEIPHWPKVWFEAQTSLQVAGKAIGADIWTNSATTGQEEALLDFMPLGCSSAEANHSQCENQRVFFFPGNWWELRLCSGLTYFPESSRAVFKWGAARTDSFPLRW